MLNFRGILPYKPNDMVGVTSTKNKKIHVLTYKNRILTKDNLAKKGGKEIQNANFVQLKRQ